MRKKPFDHPQLFVPNGHPGNEFYVSGGLLADDAFLEIPAVGKDGRTGGKKSSKSKDKLKALKPFLQ